MLGICLALIDEPSDKEKFEQLYYTYNDMMFRIAMSILHNEALANETVQDCLLKIATIISDVPSAGTNKAQALITIIVRNRSLNNLKLEHYDKVYPLDETEIISRDVLSDVISDMGHKQLVREICSLDKIYSDILTLKLLYGYSVEEICALLEISKRTAESRIYRGRKILKEQLEKAYNEQHV